MESKKGRACSSSSVKVLAFRSDRNKPLKKLRQKVHSSLMGKPLDDSIVSAIKSRLAKLEPEVKKANDFLEEACQRKDDGKLNETTFQAETLAARTIISLCEILETTLENAVAAKDAYAVECVGHAAQVLLGRIESGSLLRKVAYPKGRMQDVFVRERYKTVGDANGAVVEALDGSHATYSDVDLPELAQPQ